MVKITLKAIRERWEKGLPTGVSDDTYDTLDAAAGDDYVGPKGSVPHTVPMLSLQKVRDTCAMVTWADGRVIAVTPKVDGVACSLTYEAGKLVQATTRGDGNFGENILVDVLPSSIPRYIPENNVTWVRGEIYIRSADFISLTELPATQDLNKQYKSPRNLAAGLIRRLQRDPEHRVLSFYPYDCALTSPSVNNIYEKMDVLRQASFDFAGALPVAVHPYQAITTDWLQSVATKFPADTDGVVLRLYSNKAYDAAGRTRHHPKGAIALKFTDEAKMATLVGVSWSVSRNRTITPVAEFTPVTLAGASITRATLHNYATFKGLHLRTGDTIEITRRGGIIPHVERVVSATDSGTPLEAPTRCPSCTGDVQPKGETLVCMSPTCGVALANSIIHFYRTLKVKGLGETLCQELLDLNPWLQFPTELVADATRVVWPAGKDAQKVRLQLRDLQRGEVPSAMLLLASGIDGVGEAVAERILEVFSLNEALTASTDFTKVQGVKTQMAQRIASSVDAMPKAYREQLTTGFKAVAVSRAPKVIGPLSGKTVLITGTLCCPREQAFAQVERLGGRNVQTASASLTYLIDASVGDVTSTKRKVVNSLIAKGAKIVVLNKNQGEKLLGL